MKSFFPATYSSLCPDALATYLSDSYPLRDVKCSLLVRGVGDTYLVESAGGRFILRIYRASHRTFAHVQAEVALLLGLKEGGVPVAYPIADQSGQTIQLIDAVEGRRCAVLFSYAPGAAVRILSKTQLHIFGREMAHFHQISSKIQLPGERWTFDIQTALLGPLEMIRPGFAEDQETYAWLRNVVQRVAGHLASVDAAGLSSGYVHFDFLPKNMHFEGDSVTLFDFDFMGYGWLVFDIAIFWQHLMIEVYTQRMTYEVYEESYAILIAGYREVRPVSEEELALVPYLALGFWLFYMGFHTSHDQFTSFTHLSQLKSFSGFIKYLEQNYYAGLPGKAV